MLPEELKWRLTDNDILALTIIGEARGEPIEGQVAVANVIKNRLTKNPSRYHSYKDVCLERHQFSCWNDNDVNHDKLVELARLLLDGASVPQLLKQCFWVSRGVIEWVIQDNTHGAVNYMTTSLFHSDKRPSWSHNAKNEIVKGNHTFFSV